MTLSIQSNRKPSPPDVAVQAKSEGQDELLEGHVPHGLRHHGQRGRRPRRGPQRNPEQSHLRPDAVLARKEEGVYS